MRTPSILAGLASTAALLPATYASVAIRDPTLEQAAAEALAVPLAALKRATPDAPNGYAPAAVDCLSTRPSIRNATHLSPEELEWLPVRRNNTVWAMRDLLGRMNITGLDTDAYIDSAAQNVSALPNIGVALSGGGYRALLNGAGVVAAFDNRTANSTGTGHLGGLLQASTYLAGLSGGSWMVGSLYVDNFTSVQEILDKDTAGDNTGAMWQFGNSIFEGPDTGSIQILSSAEYYSTIYGDVQDKNDAGFNTTITDYWGRALSYQLVNASNGGPSYTFSSIANDDYFIAGNSPMPIFVADGRKPGELVIDGNATVYEINPWELGTFDPTTFGFAPLRYLGTNFTAGDIPDNEQCVRGFDNAGFIMGTSSTLFNQAFLTINGTSSSLITNALTSVLADIGEDHEDIADYPNPFYLWNNATNPVAQLPHLTLVDGGEDLQNIPLHPLIQPERGLDVIFAVDSSADTVQDGYSGWPDGASVIATYARTKLPISNGTSFPAVPDNNTFVNLGFNNRPTFFGCDASNTTEITPLIVYLPNAPYVYQSNTSTYQMSYNDAERNFIIENGYVGATMGNGTLDSQWPTCVGCAILSRSLTRTGTTVPDVCQQCFDRYCWDGTINSTYNEYRPELKIGQLQATSGAGRRSVSAMALTAALAVTAALVM